MEEAKNNLMKTILLFLLITTGMFAQEVFETEPVEIEYDNNGLIEQTNTINIGTDFYGNEIIEVELPNNNFNNTDIYVTEGFFGERSVIIINNVQTKPF